MPKIREASNTATETAVRERLTITAKRMRRTVSEKSLANLKRFEPGVSGNPGGKPKVLGEILALGNKYTKEIMERLIDAAINDDNPNVWIPCAKEVLNRTFGKPNQQVEVIGGLEHRHFVLRAPPVLSSSDEWERQYDTGEQAIDITAIEIAPDKDGKD